MAIIYQGTTAGSQLSGPIGDRHPPIGFHIYIHDLVVRFGQNGDDRRSERVPDDLPKPRAINISHTGRRKRSIKRTDSKGNYGSKIVDTTCQCRRKTPR